MTRAEREEFLRRYLEGEMNLEQEHDFLIQAALDKELRHELKAQQTIDKAFRKDRVVDPSAYASLQMSVSALLASPVREIRPTPANSASLPGRLFGREGQRWMLGGLVGAALLGGALLLGLPDREEQTVPRPPQVVTQSVVRPQNVESAEIGRDHGAVLPAEVKEQRERTVADVSGAARSRPAALSAPASAPSPSARSGRDLEQRTIAVAPAEIDSTTEMPAAVAPAITSAPLDSAARSVDPTETRDSIGIGIRLQWKN